MTNAPAITRRALLASFGSLIALPLLPRLASAEPHGVTIQTSPIAGFQYHQGERLWQHLRVGDKLTLVCEPENKYDPRAVRVDWRGHKLGYVPRLENTAVVQMLDRGQQLQARIERLRDALDLWERVLFLVELRR